MSLSKQIILFISSMLLILLVGTFVLNFHNTKTFLEHQLKSHSQDTATSLGLSLSSVAGGEDTSSMDTMINAVFDRGYYAFIALYDVDGKLIYKKTNTSSIQGIPNWFMNIIPIKAPIAEALVQTGWMPIGKLVVESHPGYAYIELWKTTLSLVVWFLFAAFLSIALAIYALRIMLNPLKKLEQQAEAIVKKEYLLQENLPNTTEFKQVVSAMNTMVHKMKDVFDRDAKISEKLQKIAYQDSVTGLSNRLHFEMNIDSLLDPKSEALPGIMLLLRIQNLKEINDKFGYPVGDKFVKLLSEKLQSHLAQKAGLMARLNGTELIMVMPNASASPVITKVSAVIDDIPRVLSELNMPSEFADLNIGVIHYEPGQTRGALLTQLDIAIAEANKQGKNSFFHAQQTDDQADENMWSELIDAAIQENRFILFQQSAYSAERKIHSSELLIRLKDINGELQSAGYFMPAVMRLQKENEIDQLVIRLALDYLSHLKPTEEAHLSINLTSSILHNKTLHDWLFDNIRGITPERLAFEIPEAIIHDQKALAWPLLKDINAQGFQFGIDNFGGQFNKLSFLQDLRPDFIKLDMSFTHVIEKDEQTRSYLSSLVEMCKSLDILVIAMAIENEGQKKAFEALGISLFQGYLYGAPKPLLTPH